MYYHIKDGQLIRPLPGYFNGFKDDLATVDPKLLSEMQADYMSIPDDEIVEVDDATHNTFMALQQCLENRRNAYRAESDDLYFEAIYDAQITHTEPDLSRWKAKVQQIKLCYPKPK